MSLIPNAVSSKVAMALLKTQKHSPTLLFGAGVIGIASTVVLAARATLKLEEILKEAEIVNDQIDSVINFEGYTPEDRVKDKTLLKVKTAIKIVKLYIPSVALGAVSIGLLCGSHNILSKRNAALTAAFATLEKGFRDYRNRVINDLGEDKDRQYRYGVESEQGVYVDESGKKTSVKKKVATRVSPYGVLFHEQNPNWVHVPEYNYLFIRGQQNYANEQLQSKGYLLLNDVLTGLGFERTKEGCVVGWLANGEGDGYVDFGLFEDKDALRIHDYITGREGELYLDFNVDGLVYDKI